MRRKERERDAEFAWEVFDKAKYAVLSTVNSDGTPYCIPISPVRNADVVYFHCALAGQKTDNILSNANVCLTAVSEMENIEDKLTVKYKSMVLNGKACIVSEKDEKIAAMRLVCEKYAPSNMTLFDDSNYKWLSATCVVKINVTDITGKCNN